MINSLKEIVTEKEKQIIKLNSEIKNLKDKKHGNPNQHKNSNGLENRSNNQRIRVEANNEWFNRTINSNSNDSNSNSTKISTIIAIPSDPSKVNQLITTISNELKPFKQKIKFHQLTKNKVDNIIIKIEETDEETDLIDHLKKLDNIRNVFKSVDTRTIMIKQIEKWIENSELINGIAEDNGLKSRDLKLLKIIDRKEYSNKRIIIRILKDDPDKLGDKIKVGYKYAPFDLIDYKEKCFYCGKSGHRAYEKITDENGTVSFKLKCRNSPKCIKCSGNHEMRKCTAHNNGSNTANLQNSTNDNLDD